jgi:hypothetical protein
MKIYKQDLAILGACGVQGHAPAQIQNVRVEHGKLVATDGRILSVREMGKEDAEADFKPFVLEPKALKTLAASGAFLDAGVNGTIKVRSAVQVRDRKGRFTSQLKDNGWETTIKKSEEGLYAYPDYSRVIPGEEQAKIVVKLSPLFLERLMKTFAGVETVEMRVSDPENAIRFDGKMADGRKVLGVIMPCVSR